MRLRRFNDNFFFCQNLSCDFFAPTGIRFRMLTAADGSRINHIEAVGLRIQHVNRNIIIDEFITQ